MMFSACSRRTSSPHDPHARTAAWRDGARSDRRFALLLPRFLLPVQGFPGDACRQQVIRYALKRAIVQTFTRERNHPLNQLTYGTLSHPGLLYNNPLSVAKIEEVIELLGLSDPAPVLDIGSGRGELLIRLIERYQVRALGLDLDESDTQHAREQAAKRVPPGRLQLRACDATTFEPEPDTFDLAICLGACHIYGGFRPTLERLARAVRPGGKVLVGDCYWKQEPAQEYLVALETTRDAFGTHVENVTMGVSLGLIPMYACVSNEDEWDRFEWLQMHERFALHKPDDPQLPAVIAQIHAWRDIYLRWGRDTLGFGLYLFQK
jgi:SAM-dependent methyltransferase